MAAFTIYAGPGKLYVGTTVLWPQGENGELRYVITQEKNDAGQAMHGRVASTLGDTTGLISLTPFDNWSALGLLFPAFIGVSVGATSGAMVIGTRPHGTTDVPGKIWNPNGTGIVVKRVAVTKHPDIHLGVDKPLFGAMEFTALPASSSGVFAAIGSAAAFHTITESGMADPGGNMILTDFIREAWTGAWGTVTGFGGDGGAALQAEEEWVISADVKYSKLSVQKQTLAMKLDSVQFMAKFRPVGPTWTNIEAAALTGRALGSRWAFPTSNAAPSAATDLVLTSTSGKTVTLKNCDVQGEGFEFGGTKLSTGELAFITQKHFTTGAPDPELIFSV